jgi:hypothetical protein
MSHARPITTQVEWDRKHHLEEQRQRRNEIFSRVALLVSLAAIFSITLYVGTVAP